MTSLLRQQWAVGAGGSVASLSTASDTSVAKCSNSKPMLIPRTNIQLLDTVCTYIHNYERARRVISLFICREPDSNYWCVWTDNQLKSKKVLMSKVRGVSSNLYNYLVNISKDTF